MRALVDMGSGIKKGSDLVSTSKKQGGRKKNNKTISKGKKNIVSPENPHS